MSDNSTSSGGRSDEDEGDHSIRFNDWSNVDKVVRDLDRLQDSPTELDLSLSDRPELEIGITVGRLVRLLDAVGRHRLIRNFALRGPFRFYSAVLAHEGESSSASEWDQDSRGRLRGGAAVIDQELQGANERPDWKEQVTVSLERLFTTVLVSPSFPGLIRLASVDSCWVELLVRSFPADKILRHLCIYDTDLQPSCVAAVAEMLRRNIRLRMLEMVDCGSIGLEGCKMLCDGVLQNAHLRELWVAHVDTAAFAPAVSRGSPLERLTIGIDWTEEGFFSLVEGLRTNERMKRVKFFFRGWPPYESPALLEDLVLRHNFTLRGLVFDKHDMLQDRIDDLLKRNAIVRKTNRRLARRQYRVARRSVWPEVLGRVSRMPSLVYRFLRRGNVDAFCDQIAIAASASEDEVKSSGPGKRPRHAVVVSSSELDRKGR
jgi:hypothetical protein